MEVMRELRDEEDMLQRRKTKAGLGRALDEVDKLSDTDQEIRSGSGDIIQSTEYTGKQNEEKTDTTVLIGDSFMAHCREHLQIHENKHHQCKGAEIRFKRGAILDEIIEEAKSVTFGKEGGILIYTKGRK